jgi:peptidoglycan hydrolase CwlO-like protein
MSAEAVGGIVAKYLWAPFCAWFLWKIQTREQRIKDLEKHQQDSETELTLLKQEVDTLKQGLQIFLEKHDELHKDIGDIKTNVAVISNDIKHIKEDR